MCSAPAIVPTYLNQCYETSQPRASPIAAYHNILSNKQCIKTVERHSAARARTNYKQLDAMLPPRRAPPRRARPGANAARYYPIYCILETKNTGP